ncbi:methyltransferase domain-containing protein [Roseibium salinum]|nr:methyltransferase domain-containing protein [Roseibium salinum]
MIAAAKALTQHQDPRPQFLPAPAEALPFEEKSFDGIISTYGVIFSDDPAAAAREMARVLKPGGRFALATWADETEGYIAGFFNLIAAFSDAPRPASSPFDWGRPDWLQQMFADDFRIGWRRQTTTFYAPDPAAVWHEYLRGFGPVAATHAALPDARRAEFREAFEALHRKYETEVGLVIPRQALLVRGKRV